MPKRKMEVPVGVEQLLYLAARDVAFKNSLLADRKGTLSQMDIRLRASEIVTIESIPNDALEAMIAHIRPDNPKHRKVMRVVATAAATLAVGTAVISCDDCCTATCGGVDPGTFVDGWDAGGKRDETGDTE